MERTEQSVEEYVETNFMKKVYNIGQTVCAKIVRLVKNITAYFDLESRNITMRVIITRRQHTVLLFI
jgi:hypothetical protein